MPTASPLDNIGRFIVKRATTALFLLALIGPPPLSSDIERGCLPAITVAMYITTTAKGWEMYMWLRSGSREKSSFFFDLGKVCFHNVVIWHLRLSTTLVIWVIPMRYIFQYLPPLPFSIVCICPSVISQATEIPVITKHHRSLPYSFLHCSIFTLMFHFWGSVWFVVIIS